MDMAMRASRIDWQGDRGGELGGNERGAPSPARLSPDDDSADVDWNYHWTPAARREFLEVLAATGTVLTAARSVGKTRRSAYLQRSRADAAAFRIAWDAAVLVAQNAVADALMDRALHGYDEIVEALGDGCIRRRRFDHGLGFRLLDRIDRMAGAQPQTGSYAERVQMVVQDFAGFLDLVDPAGALAGTRLSTAADIAADAHIERRDDASPDCDAHPGELAPLETKSAADDRGGSDAGATSETLDSWFAGRSTTYQSPLERELARNSAADSTVRYRAEQAAWGPVVAWFDALRARLASEAPQSGLHGQSIIELMDSMERPDFPIALTPGDEAEMSILFAAAHARMALMEMEIATPRQPEREEGVRRRIAVLDSLRSQ